MPMLAMAIVDLVANCVSDRRDLILGAKRRPELYHEYIACERVINHTMFFKTTQKTHKDIRVDLVTGKEIIVKRVEKTIHPISIMDKVGLPYDELAVQRLVRELSARRD